MVMKEQRHASELLPKSREALPVLQRRAKQLAKQEQNNDEINGIDYVRFTLSHNENYGVPYQYVQEILHNVIVTKPPFVPHFVAGIINWRGALITIVDLTTFFHPSHSEPGSVSENEIKGNTAVNTPVSKEPHSEFILIISAQNITLGLIAHQIEGSAVYQPNHLGFPLSCVNVANPEYILGLHHAVTAILNIDVLIPRLSQEIKQNLYRTGEIHGSSL